jgi:endonuclease/exonuclease/phosphatase family metal-dependent hydrolase
VLHPQLAAADAAQLASWLAQQQQVVQAVAADAAQLQALLKRNVKHAAALQLLLCVQANLEQQQQQGEASAVKEQDGAAVQLQDATTENTSSSSSSSSDATFLRELLLEVLSTQSTGDALSVLLQHVTLPPGLLRDAAKVVVHPDKAATVVQWLPQLLELGLPPDVKVRMSLPWCRV